MAAPLALGTTSSIPRRLLADISKKNLGDIFGYISSDSRVYLGHISGASRRCLGARVSPTSDGASPATRSHGAGEWSRQSSRYTSKRRRSRLVNERFDQSMSKSAD